MNSNRAMMRVKLADLQDQQKDVRRKARNGCTLICPMINPALSDIEDMDIAGAAAAMDDLVMLQAELLSLQSKIAELEESLYG